MIIHEPLQETTLSIFGGKPQSVIHNPVNAANPALTSVDSLSVPSLMVCSVIFRLFLLMRIEYIVNILKNEACVTEGENRQGKSFRHSQQIGSHVRSRPKLFKLSKLT